MGEYKGPAHIGWSSMPGRGTSYSGDFDGHDVQVYVTEKLKRVRVFVDGVEYVKPKEESAYRTYYELLSAVRRPEEQARAFAPPEEDA